MSKTVAQRTNQDGFPKAGEMIEIRQSSSLTLHDRRVLNLLIQHAGPQIASDVQHIIPMRELRSRDHKGGEMVRDSIIKLMTTLVEVPTTDSKGNPATLRTALLASTTTTDDEDKPDGEVVYRFSSEMRQILQRSAYWGRIKPHVMFAFSSKYALALYENLCLRRNLHKTEQYFDLATFREMLGVAPGKLKEAFNLMRWAVQPTIEEINALSDFNVVIDPVRQGGMQRGKLLGFQVIWEPKEPHEWRSVLEELGRSKVGRKARIRGEMDKVAIN